MIDCPSSKDAQAVADIPRTAWALGFVRMFINISAEIIRAPLQLFLTATLVASVAVVELIGGIAKVTASYE